MTERLEFTTEEREQSLSLYAELKEKIAPTLEAGDEDSVRHHLLQAIEENQVRRDVFGLNPIVKSLQTALLVVDEIGLRRDAVLAILLNPCVEAGFISIDEVGQEYGLAVARILHGLQRIQELYQKNPVIESENFRNLLLSFAEDMRVILIMIADRVNLMRQIRDVMAGERFSRNEEGGMRKEDSSAGAFSRNEERLRVGERSSGMGGMRKEESSDFSRNEEGGMRKEDSSAGAFSRNEERLRVGERSSGMGGMRKEDSSDFSRNEERLRVGERSSGMGGMRKEDSSASAFSRNEERLRVGERSSGMGGERREDSSDFSRGDLEEKRRLGKEVSEEAAYLYAPLAHKLGLYKLKSELEDLSLKYLEHDAYYHIKEKLNATKQARDAYIERFIGPIAQKLKEAGLTFHMKGRTKSIHSIWQKMKKQKCDFEGVYDLFAIRIIIDCPVEKEKQQCWQTFAIITDMYTSNPKRMRDWLSVPKSNGYESLHITVLGPEKKWVEVQIRTERMDEIAERGVAAHWRYKGVKAEGGMDDWLNGIRQMLESANGIEAMDQFKMDLYDDEIYVFTPKGDLLKFPKGATVLDMAYHIHSKVGSACTGARINNKVVTFRQELHSGDQVEILTSSSQYPKQEWLHIVKTSRAKAKIRLALKETQQKEALMVKEMLERKFKNHKIDQEESLMMRTMKKLGYKEASDFYRDIAHDTLDVQTILDKYVELQQGEKGIIGDNQARSAEEFELDNSQLSPLNSQQSSDVLVIGQDLKGVDYQLAKCCNPIYGDQVFGFVTVTGGIKIHRCDCPNAPEMRRRFGYRIVKAKWSGKGSSQYAITLRVIGNDDLGIVNNLTSIISKDEKLVLRSINIDSNDGLFRGTLTIMINDNTKLETLIKKLRTVKGVKQVERI